MCGRGIGALAIALFGAVGFCPAEEPKPALTNAAAVRKLSKESAGRAVQVRGIITYRDQAWGYLILQDETGGFPVAISKSELPFAIGNRVEIEGVTTSILGSGGIEQPVVRLIESAALPEPLPVMIPELFAGRHDAMRVEVAGVISATDVVRGRAMLHLHAGTNHLDVIVRDLSPADPLLPRLVGAHVRVRGTSCHALLQNSRNPRPYLLTADTNEVTIVRPAQEGPFDSPAVAIRDISATNTDARVKIVARIQTELSNWVCTVSDDSGSMRVRAQRGVRIKAGDRAEVAGFPATTREGTILDHAVFRLLARPDAKPGSKSNAVVAFTNQYVPVLQTAAEVRRLAPEDANRGHPVRLRGVVTFCDGPSQSLFIRDATTGIFIWPADTNLPVRVSDIIEVSGFSGAGRYAPIVVGGRVSKIAAGELPPPLTVPFEQLMSGKHDCDRVTMDGIVRSFMLWQGSAFLNVAAQGGTFTAVVVSTNQAALAKLVDAEVRFHGVCGTEVNNRRQLVGLKIFVPGLDDIVVKEPAPNDPFTLPVRDVASLFSFQPQERAGHRVRVRGVVTMQRRADTFFIRDDTGALFIELLGEQAVQAGDIVEAAGFPTVHGIATSLQKTLARVVGRTNPPAARPVTVSQAIKDGQDGEWVSVEARLLEVSVRGEQPVLVLESGRNVFEAQWIRTNATAAFQHLRPGFLLRVEGICQLQAEEGRAPRSFRLQCRSPEAITILQRTPWWTLRHALALGGGLAALVLAAFAWGFFLRRQVRKQTSVIRELNTGLERRVTERTAELEAANQELESFSYSVSHDLRAPLRAVNGFAEILLQTHAPQLDEKGSRYLRNVADGGRRMGRLVDELLSFSRLGRQPLAKAPIDLNDLAAQIIDDLRRHDLQRPVTIRVQPLPPAEGDRGLIQQALVNLLGNAWKFTARREDARIEIGCLAPGPGPVYFVRDNGAGFDMKYADKIFGVFQRLHRDDEFPGTGVGLAIVQRIIQRHGGRIWAESKPGEGATFYFTLPAGSLKNEACSAFGK